ncbi:MAG: Two-component sensor kinase [Ignavibacteria bacterium]|nr:Two-component sensor kinase [Ignavibacteria bacterium]
MKRIFSKIFVGYIFLIGLLVIPIIYFSYESISHYYLESTIENEVRTCYTLELAIRPYLSNMQFLTLDSAIKELNKKINSRITVIDKNGKVIADSKAVPGKMENHSDRPEVQKALKEGFGKSIRHSYTVKKDMIYVAIPIKIDSALFGVIRLSVFMDDYLILFNELVFKIFNISIIIVCIALLAAYLLSRTFTKPIQNLVRVSENLANGDFNVNVNIKTKDEFKILGDSINLMIEQIGTLFRKTNSQKEELNRIISSIQEGLVVLDENHRISLCNDSFIKITGQKKVIGKMYWEIFRDNNTDKILKNMVASSSNISSEIEFRNEFYICSANHINDNKEIVLIFYNISELKKLENMKKDFVINVSHELRTPLTVIKGYIETIESDIDEPNRKYIEIIKNHTNRLINIVQDLLSISRIEEKNSKLNISEINLPILFNNLTSTFDQKLKSKNLSMDIHIDNNIESMKADEFILEQMFINLIDNAIKYTEKGGIVINAKIEDSSIKFEVIDSGIGIPEKDRERIFERFYTVDKSRSRQNAGTGLGLAIVKHIVMLHNGKISVESTEGVGSKFIITFPKLIC